MSDISVNYHGVGDIAAQVRSSADQIKSDLDHLHTRVSRAAASWTGEAQVAYSALQRDWSAKTEDLHRVLYEIARRVSDATEDYQGTDRKIARNMQR